MSTRRPSLKREAALWSEGCSIVAGIDEVGRGPLAGPVVAAAVVFPAGIAPIEGVRDSKTLSSIQRASLVPQLQAQAVAVGLGAASAHEIDRLNIRIATAVAMRRAIARARRRADVSAQVTRGFQILIDGLPVPELGYPHQALVDGDACCYSIAAAGVLAKELRDELMRRLARLHPSYGWETNVGYGTPAHCSALNAYGPSAHHRRSFAPVVQLPLFD